MKWIGVLMLVAASYFCGHTLSAEEAKKLKAVESLGQFLKYMRRRMLAERAPLDLLFSSFEDEYLEEIGFLQILRNNRRQINASWNAASELLPLEKEIKSELKRFGNELGILSLEEQIKRLDSCLEVLEGEKNSISETLPSKQKSIKTVCLLCGLLTAILLI